MHPISEKNNRRAAAILFSGPEVFWVKKKLNPGHLKISDFFQNSRHMLHGPSTKYVCTNSHVLDPLPHREKGKFYRERMLDRVT